MQEALKRLECPITGQIFYDPVTVTTKSVKNKTSKTFEREAIEQWIQRLKKSGAVITDPMSREEISEELASNDIVRGMARDYVQAHPELYEQDYVYLPDSVKNELIDAIQAGEIQQIKDTLQKDPRLITTNLNGDGLTALQAVSQQASLDVFRLILEKLPKIESDKHKHQILKEGNLAFIATISHYLGIQGLDIWCQYLKFDMQFFYRFLSQQAILRHDAELLSILIPRSNINMQETNTGFTFLHTAVQVCTERLANINSAEVTASDLLVINVLLNNGADAKKRDNNGDTPGQLAEKLGNSLLARAVENERRRIKYAPLIDPLKERIRELEVKCYQLELAKAQLLLKLTKHEQAIVETEQTQRQQLAVSEGLLQLKQQKQIQAFVPKLIKSIFPRLNNIGQTLKIGANFLVCVSSSGGMEYKSEIIIYDLSKASDKCIVATIILDETFPEIIPIHGVDDKRIVYLAREYNKEIWDGTKIVVYNIEANLQEKAYIMNKKKYSLDITIIQVINAEWVFFCWSHPNDSVSYALLNLISGEERALQCSTQIFDRKSYYGTVSKSCYLNSELAYQNNSYDRGRHSKNIKLYDVMTNTHSSLLEGVAAAYEYPAANLDVFKFVSTNLLAISVHYANVVDKSIQIINVNTKKIVRTLHLTFEAPNERSQGRGLFDVCLTSGGLLIVGYYAQEPRMVILELSTGLTKYNIPIKEGKFIFDEIRNVLYVSHYKGVDAYQVYPDKILNNTSAGTQKSDYKTETSGKIFNL